jgi:hypothetical protein
MVDGIFVAYRYVMPSLVKRLKKKTGSEAKLETSFKGVQLGQR